jgi:dTDP-glucose 4,6-dehydratase
VNENGILVTGGAGFIGSALVRRLVAAGETVVNIDCLTYAGNLESLAEANDSPQHVLERADIRDADALRRIFETYRPRAVLHLAAESHVDRSIDAADAFIQTNIVGTFHLLEAARRHVSQLTAAGRKAFRFIHVSTDEVFGSLGEEGRFDEGTPYDPRSPYAASKAASDHLARAWRHTYDVPIIVTNCTNNYGPYQFPEKLIPLIILTALRRERLPVYGDGTNVRDWIYVDDHVDGLLAALERGEPGDTYGFGGNAERRNIDVVRTVCSLLDEIQPHADGPYAELITFVRDRPGHDFRYAMDPTHAAAALGWTPRHDFESGLRETVRWYVNHAAWCERVQSGAYRGERLGLGV